MYKKIKITDPITKVSAIFSGIASEEMTANDEERIFAKIYSVENAKERFAEDLIHAQRFLEGKYRYTQAFEEDGHVGWESGIDYREFNYYGEMSSIIKRIVVEEM